MTGDFTLQFVITARWGVFLPIYVLRWLLQNFWKWQYIILSFNPITNVVKYRGKKEENVYFVTEIALETNYTIFYNVKILIDRKIFIPSYYWKRVNIFRFENVLTNDNKSTCIRLGLYHCVHFCFPVIYKLVNIFVMLYFYLDTPVHLLIFFPYIWNRIHFHWEKGMKILNG
jgi:hypothetical protein